MRVPRLRAVVLGASLAMVAAGPLCSAPLPTSPPPSSTTASSSASPAPSPPTPAQIRRATEQVLAKGKYRRQPHEAQRWLQERLEALLERLGQWLDSLAGNSALLRGANAVFYALVGVVALTGLLLLVRYARGRRRGLRARRLLPARAPTRDVPTGDLPSRARALAAAGEYGAALRLWAQACVPALDRRGLLVAAPSATDGEYLRQLDAHPEAHALLAELLQLVALHLYGGRDLDRAQYQRGERAAGLLLRGEPAS